MQIIPKILYILLFFSALSCNTSTNKPSKPETEAEKQKHFENFASQLEKTIKNGDYTFLNTSWDIGLFNQKLVALGKVDNNVLEGGEKYYRKVIYKSNNDMVFEVKKFG